ncbi:hypothetical protein A6V39_04250 [Candidatus Mycoplasma haematobovis]|uniref:Uncharacterized protein n=1 Tax=Candidatus Mycoplasma haematobovis TaxID=432608 RepID=A0A1A9QCZ2_9MOLU|nr:hypothetical protein [Candidatus Mycoplasma haematobovis]OAL10098.1 hypothetical protein A6V39_04250 [Candidatus Mycoplasma haematobovis]
MLFWRKKKIEIQEKPTIVPQVKRPEQPILKRLSLKTVEILSNFDFPLVILTEKEEIGERLAQRRIRLLSEKLGFKPTEIIVFFSSSYKDKFWKEATSFWRVFGGLCNNDLSQINDPNKRKRLFTLANFEKYKAFIILAPLERGNVLNEFISRIKGEHNNILWLANQAILSQRQFTLPDGLFSFYGKGKAREFKDGTLLHVDMYKSEVLNGEEKSPSNFETKVTIGLNSVACQSAPFQLSAEIGKYVSEDNCFLFSENNNLLKVIAEERINRISKNSQKIKIITFSQNWKPHPNVTLINPRFLSNYQIDKASFESVVFYEDIDDNVKNCIAKCLQLNIKVFVAFRQKDWDILTIFKENCRRFILLDFESKFAGDAKVFSSPLLSVNSTSAEVGELQLDAEVKRHVFENNCLFLSKDLKVLEKITSVRVNYLSQLSKEKLNVLIISPLFENSEIFELKGELNIVKHDFESFVKNCIFKDSKLSSGWEEEAKKQLEKFDAFIFLEKPSSLLNLIIATALKVCQSVLVLLQKQSKDILEIFKENCRRFTYLNFEEDFTGSRSVFERSLLSIGPKISETKELQLDPEVKKYIFEDNCFVFSKNWDVLKRLVQERIDKIKNELSIRIVSPLSNWQKNPNITLIKPEVLLNNHSLQQDTDFNYLVVCEDDGENLLKFIARCLNSNIKVFVALRRESQLTLSTFKVNCQKFVYLNFDNGLLAEAEIFPKTLSSETSRILTVNEPISIFEDYVHPEKNVQDKEDPLFDEINPEVAGGSFEVKKNLENNPSPTENQDEKLSIVLDIQGEEFSEKSLEVIEDFSKPLAILTENEEVSKKLAFERISLMRNKYGLSPNQIMIAFSSSYKDDSSLEVDSFWKTCENLCDNDLHQIYHEYQRRRIFDSVNFENKYKAFIIISTFDCNIVLKEFVNRIKGISNVLWLACYPDLSEENFLLIDDLLPTYSKFKAIESKDGQTINIDSFSKKKPEVKSTFLFEEAQEEDLLFEDAEYDSYSEVDPLFDDTQEFKESDPPDDDDDIDGGLF